MVRKEKDMKYAKNFKRALALMTAVSLGSFPQSENTEVLKNIRRFYYANKRDYYSLIKSGPEDYTFCLEEDLEHYASSIEAYKISQNLELYASNKMNYDIEELYTNTLNYLKDNDKEAKAYICLIQSLIDYKGSDDIRFALNILIDPWQYKSYLEERYGKGVLEKISSWKTYLCDDKNSPFLEEFLPPSFEDSKSLYEACSLNDIEEEILYPYPSLHENKSGNMINYNVVWNFQSRITGEYEFVVSDNYLNNYHVVISNTKNPYEKIEEKIKEQGKNKIIEALKIDTIDDEIVFWNNPSLILGLLSLLDSDVISLKENETYEEYFKRLEECFPKLDVYRFAVCVSLANDYENAWSTIKDAYAYKVFMPFYLEKLSQKEKITKEDIEIYNEVFKRFFRNFFRNATTSANFKPIKEQFDTELEYILYSKNEAELINEIASFETSLFDDSYVRTRNLYSKD